MKNKGYIFTVSTFFLLSSVLLLALFFSSRSDEADISGPKLASLYDDIRGDVFELMEVSVTQGNISNFTVVEFKEEMSISGIRDRLKSYERFMEKDLSSKVNQYLEDRQGSLTVADVSMSLSKTAYLLQPYRYIYEYDDMEKDEITIYPQDNNTNLLALVVNLSVDQGIVFINESLESGGIPLRIIVRGANLTYDHTLNVSGNSSSEVYFVLPHGGVNISSGPAFVSGFQRNNTFSVSLDGAADADATFTLIFWKSMRFLLESGFTITLRDILGYRMARKEGSQFTEIIDFTRIKDNIWFPVREKRIGQLPLEVEVPDLPEEPGYRILLGFCYCKAPCYYWEEYWEGSIPCDLRVCPSEDPENPNCHGEPMLTFLL